MDDTEPIQRAIHEAFVDIEYPGDWCLRGSNEGEEPYLVEEDFKGKTDWRVLDGAFLDPAPKGYATALCFFSRGGIPVLPAGVHARRPGGKVPDPSPVLPVDLRADGRDAGGAGEPAAVRGPALDGLCAIPIVRICARAGPRHRRLFALETGETPHFCDEIEQSLHHFWLERASAGGNRRFNGMARPSPGPNSELTQLPEVSYTTPVKPAASACAERAGLELMLAFHPFLIQVACNSRLRRATTHDAPAIRRDT